jgi:NAD(P)-dependent dehydrogenase (short-subunit alcohol dehydrogenase family)
MRLNDKVAIATGAGTGIGEVIAHKFAREGARVLWRAAERPGEGRGDCDHRAGARGGRYTLRAEVFRAAATCR